MQTLRNWEKTIMSNAPVNRHFHSTDFNEHWMRDHIRTYTEFHVFVGCVNVDCESFQEFLHH